MFDSLTSPKNIKMRRMSEKVAGDITIGTMTLRDIIASVQKGIVRPYKNNRGNGVLNMSKVRRIASSYNSRKLGMIILSDNGDGTYTQADAHHRISAIMKKSNQEDDITGFTEEQLNHRVPVQVINSSNFMEVYSGTNDNNGHGSRARVLNPDMGLGSLNESILSLQKLESCVVNKFHVTLVRCTYGFIGKFGVPIKDLSYADISLDRRIVNADAALSKEDYEVSVSNKQKIAIAEALDYVNEVHIHYKNLNNLSTKKGTKIKLNQTARSLTSSAALFGFLLWDKLSGREQIAYYKPKSLALRITEKDAQIDKQSKLLLNSVSQDTAANNIVAYIKTKKRK